MRGTKDSEWRCTELTLGLDTRDISRFSPRIDRIFPGGAIYPFFDAQDEGFLEFRAAFSFLTLLLKASSHQSQE